MDYLTDISYLYTASGSATTVATHSTSSSSGDSLDMMDFLELMVCQLQNQTIDDTADTSDMLNQLVQMQVVQSITQITEATNTLYASSLVGKEVTIGQYDAMGNLTLATGTVTGAGYSDGSYVVFIGEDCYDIGDVMAIGRLPSTLEDTQTQSVASVLPDSQAQGAASLYGVQDSSQTDETEETSNDTGYEVEDVAPVNETENAPTDYELEDVTANLALDEVG
jgi:flagellar basal-body rod modification protein FlgD